MAELDRESAFMIRVLCLACVAVALSCAEPNRKDGPAPERVEAGNQGRAPDGAGTIGQGGSGGGVTGGQGGDCVPHTAASTRLKRLQWSLTALAPAGRIGACNPGTTRCAATVAAVEVCTVNGTWTVREPCPAVCASGACSGMCQPGTRHCGPGQVPRDVRRQRRVGCRPRAVPKRMQRAGIVYGRVQAGREEVRDRRHSRAIHVRREREVVGRNRLSESLLQRQLRWRLHAGRKALWGEQHATGLQCDGDLGTGAGLSLRMQWSW